MISHNSFSKVILAIVGLVVLPQLSYGQGNDSPVGPTGEFSGSVTTGGSYDPYTGNAKRVIEDLTVTGSLGAYPLKWNRILNTRSSGTKPFSSGWGHSYVWAVSIISPVYRPPNEEQYFGPDAQVICPDGRTVDFYGEIGVGQVMIGQAEGMDGIYYRLTNVGGGNYDLTLSDGGAVHFRSTAIIQSGQTVYYKLAKEIVDPYGQMTTLAYDTSAKLIKVTEPGGRYLQINYISVPFIYLGQTYQAVVIGNVKAFDGRGNLTETVTYTYTSITISPDTSVCLTGVTYDDGTAATYTYQGSNKLGQSRGFLVSTCNDVRYAGAMRKIEYEYMPTAANVAWGQIKREKNATTHQVISEATYPTYDPYRSPDNPVGHFRTEKRGDGTTRSFQYATSANNAPYGTLSTYTDFKGQTSSFTYQYGPIGGLSCKTVTDARGKKTYFYRDQNLGALKQVAHHDGSSITFVHSDAAKPYYLASRTDERGNTTGYVRDTNNRVQRINYPDGGYEEFTFNNFGQVLTHRMTSGGTETFTYDTRGLKTSYTPPATASDPNPAAHPTQYFYYTSGPHIDRLQSVIDPRGYTTSYEYNLRGLVTKVTHQDGTYTQTSYNGDGTVAWTADENHPGAATDANQRTRYTYDEYKRVLTVTNLLNQTAANSYAPWNGSGSLSHTTLTVYHATSPTGKAVDQEIDANFRKTRVRQAPGTADDASTYFVYDVVGNVISTTDPRGNITTCIYDDRNRKTSVTNALNQTTSTTYDIASNKLSDTLPNGEVITYDTYDVMNRLKHKTVKRDATTFDVTSMTYDLAGNLATNTDERGNVYTYVYDALNRLTSMVYPGGLHEDKSYDAAGNLASYTTRTGATQVQTFTYDNRNRATDFGWNDGVTSWQHTVYDAASHVTQIGNNISTINHTYDNANRLLTQEEWTSAFSDNVHRTLTYTYDADGNRSTVQYPSAFSFTYAYTNRNQVANLKVTGQPTPIASYTYDVAGNITNRTLDNGTSSAYTIDQLNRVSALQHNLIGGAKRFDYAFNAVSDITAVQRDSGLGDGFKYDLTQQITDFQQNGTVNLAAGTVSAPATTNPMLFDGCGNRTSLNGVGQTFDNLNRLTTTAGTTYNSNSALTAWNGWACTYDAQNRLTGAIKGAATLSFFYDAKNRQIARSINGAITFSVWDDWELVEEYTTGNVRIAAYLQGAHGPIKSLLNNVYFYQDSLGSTSHIASATGALLESYKYDLNGKPTFWSPPPLNTQLSASNYGVRDLFTGERFISEMGMYDLRNRYYSPELGHFLQPDPIGFNGDGSNLYRYCGNDWANKTDPMGLQAGHQSSDDKCTNAFNLPDWLYKDMRGLNSSQPAGNATVALTDATSANEGPKAHWDETSGNWNDKNVANHVVKNGSLGGNAGQTDSVVTSRDNPNGSITAHHKLDWWVEDRYKGTDVVTREIDHVKRWRYWQTEGDGHDAVESFNKKGFSGSARDGANALQTRLDNEYSTQFRNQHDQYDGYRGSHNLKLHPARPISPQEIYNVLSTIN